MSAVSRRSRAEEKGLAEQVAAVMRDAHVQLRLWGRCNDANCQRERNCCGDAEPCGARVAPASWAWLRHVVQGMLEGASQQAAVEAREPRPAPLSRAKDRALAREVLGSD